MNREFDPFVDQAQGRSTGSPLYDVFHGNETVVMHGLLAKAPSFEEVLIQPLALAFAEVEFRGRYAGIAMASAEFRQVGPGFAGAAAPSRRRLLVLRPRVSRPAHGFDLARLDALHRRDGGDAGCRPAAISGPGIVRCRVPDPFALALMAPGDAVFFRGDLFHGAGPNLTDHVRRRGIVTSYCLGWLRPVENSFLNLPPAQAESLPSADPGAPRLCPA